jgi:hypothetical protein
MPSTNKTPRLGLSQFVGSDGLKREDYNRDMALLDSLSGFKVLGLYPTLAALQSAHLNPARGDAYLVGTAEANTTYLWDGAEWRDVGSLAAGGEVSAEDVSLDSEDFEAVNVKGALEELFTSVSDGKTALVADIETMGGTVTPSGDVPTFAELGAGVLSIPTGSSRLKEANISLGVDMGAMVGVSVTTEVRVIE